VVNPRFERIYLQLRQIMKELFLRPIDIYNNQAAANATSIRIKKVATQQTLRRKADKVTEVLEKEATVPPKTYQIWCRSQSTTHTKKQWRKRRNSSQNKRRNSSNRSSSSSSRSDNQILGSSNGLLGHQKDEGGRAMEPAPPHKKEISSNHPNATVRNPTQLQTSQEPTDPTTVAQEADQALGGEPPRADRTGRAALQKPRKASNPQHRERSRKGVWLRARPSKNRPPKCSNHHSQHSSTGVFFSTKQQHLPRSHNR